MKQPVSTRGQADHGGRPWLPGLALALAALAVAAPACGARPAPDEPAGPDATTLFARAAPVFQHPRCMNCHPSDDFPRQGAQGRRHLLGVRRGPDDQGVPAMRCRTCHQEENQEHAGIPGAPHWALAPRSMGWQGLSAGEICRSIQDPVRNGDLGLQELVAHLSEDALVLWAWSPGAGREPPPLPHDEFVRIIRAWAEAGAGCPP